MLIIYSLYVFIKETKLYILFIQSKLFGMIIDNFSRKEKYVSERKGESKEINCFFELQFSRLDLKRIRMQTIGKMHRS